MKKQASIVTIHGYSTIVISICVGYDCLDHDKMYEYIRSVVKKMIAEFLPCRKRQLLIVDRQNKAIILENTMRTHGQNENNLV